MTPAQRAVALAAFVVTVALGLYAVVAAADRWPQLVVAAWGAALGAGMAMNGIALREIDGERSDSGQGSRRNWSAATRHQLCSAAVALSAWQTAEREHLAWAAATMALGVVWARTLPPLVEMLQHVPAERCLRAYYIAFRAFALVGASALIYASIALETEWLWRPQVPADLQLFVWLGILEFAGLPLTMIAIGE